MDYRTLLIGESIIHKMDLIDKAIEYMETVPVSTECHDAVVDMLKYEKEGIAEDFRKLTCESCIENYKKAQCGSQGVASTKSEGFVMGRDGSTKSHEGIRDDLAFHC